MSNAIINTLRNALDQGSWQILVDKLVKRVVDRPSEIEKDEIRAWCERECGDYVDLAEGLDANLWHEASAFADSFRERSQRKLASSDVKFGGGGAFDLLYFLVRLRHPQAVVETGVAAGWSSAAVLHALRCNGAGALWSSDFPYFRQSEAKSQIGLLVDPDLRANWTLFTSGDRNGLPEILKRVSSVQFFHYDSDKSYGGRVFAYESIRSRLSPDALVIFDDIQDNSHFRDLAERLATPFRVFQSGGKYLGVIGLDGVPSHW